MYVRTYIHAPTYSWQSIGSFHLLSAVFETFIWLPPLVCPGKKLADSTNLGEGEGKFVSPMHTRATPSPRLSRTAGHKRRITKSQISGPLDLIASPAVDVSGGLVHVTSYLTHMDSH